MEIKISKQEDVKVIANYDYRFPSEPAMLVKYNPRCSMKVVNIETAEDIIHIRAEIDLIEQFLTLDQPVETKE